jgi:hypothetical protein
VGVRDRLRHLEEHMLPAHWPYEEWPAQDQLEAVLDFLDTHRRFRTVGVCTDREINLLGICTAYEELGGAGEWTAPCSGAIITVTDNGDGTFNASLSANVAAEDLPEGVREYVKSWGPKGQERRDRWLFENRERFKQEREERPERLKREEEERRQRSEESRRRDRELLERNRASVGLPPLTPEESNCHRRSLP